MPDKLSPQLPLGLSLKDDATFSNFYPGKNLETIEALKQTASGKGERIVYICGARGQGCSHLLEACCHLAYRSRLRSVYLPFSNLLTFTPEILVGLETVDLICFDDLQKVARLKAWEEAIFHLFNQVYERGGRIIIAAPDLPQALNLTLADLTSRLSWGVIYQLQTLEDEDKLSALIMRAKKRGITLSKEVGRYLLTHCPRHMGTLFAALDVLDKASLAAQRRLTIPFVKEVLQI